MRMLLKVVPFTSIRNGNQCSASVEIRWRLTLREWIAINVFKAKSRPRSKNGVVKWFADPDRPCL